MKPTIRVVVVDDSPFVRGLMTTFLQSASDIQVVGTAGTGAQAVDLVARLRPDAVTLDLEMPGMNGLQVLDRLMRQTPTPVVMVSGVSRRGADLTLQAVERGAVDFVLKFAPGTEVPPRILCAEIISKVRLASRIKVIRSLGSAGSPKPRSAVRVQRTGQAGADNDMAPSLSVVVVGASTGGPPALQALLASLPEGFPAAIIVVQHLPAIFTRVLAAQLDRRVSFSVKEASPADILQSGMVYIAPGDRHLLVRQGGRIEIVEGPRFLGHRPSIDVTMHAVAQVYGTRCAGVVLTGMGEDGTRGLAAIRAAGGRTYAQDPSSCVVSSMPVQAVARGVVDRVGSPMNIARLLSVEEIRQPW